MISEVVVELSRWQFAFTALFNFLFIPLTLALSLLLLALEIRYVLNGSASVLAACRFWGRILAVNFALGLASRLALVFQFGMNASYFALYVGDVFAVPLAINALSSFFLASLLFGPYLYGWKRFGRVQHLLITVLLTLALNASVLLELIAGGWLQNPVGAVFNYHALRLELSDLSLLLRNPPAIQMALHGITAAYTTGAASILAISAWLLLKNTQDDLARSSFRLAAMLGLAATLAAGLTIAIQQQSSLEQERKLTFSADSKRPLLSEIETHIRNGVKASALLEELRDDKTEPQLLADFKQSQADLGYALLLERWTEHINKATDQQIALAAQSVEPASPGMLQGVYRAIIACGVINLLMFILAILIGFRPQPLPKWLLQLNVYLFPFSWLACVGACYLTLTGMQPWSVAEVLPSFLSMSSLSVKELCFSLSAYVLVYGGLFAVGFVVIRQVVHIHLVTLSQGVKL